jgi:hypothetical protein
MSASRLGRNGFPELNARFTHCGKLLSAPRPRCAFVIHTIRWPRPCSRFHPMKRQLFWALALAGALVVGFDRHLAAVPVAPTPLAPANGGSLQEPFTISWSAVSDPSGIVGYNWQVSPSSSFSTVILQDSTSGATSDTVSGLANGTYFWRVQAANGSFEQGAWSQTRSFTVTGVSAGAPGTPTLAPPKAYTTFHPYEVMVFTWSAVPGAATYLFQAATDSSFPVTTSIQFDNIPNTTYSFAIGNPEGNYFARVFAVDANGTRSAPSNLQSFSVFFNNPVPPALTPLSPPNGSTLTLPITIKWSESPNPQPSGYDLEIAKDSGFKTIEILDAQLNDPTRTELSLTPGQKFWRVHSVQGDASPTTAAVTPWSATGTFTVSSAPPTPVSVSFTSNPVTSGSTTWVQLQLTGAPPAATNVTLTSSNPSAAPVPATISMPANIAWTQFQMQAGQVASPAAVTITATLNGKSASGQLTVGESQLKSLTISPSTINGGATPTAIAMLTGQAPPGGAAVMLSSDSPAVTPPSSVFVDPGSFSVSFPLPTRSVAANTTATITASWNGASRQGRVTLTPQPSPSGITLSPTSTVGTGGSSFGRVTIASAQATDTTFQLTSSDPAIARVNNGMTIPSGTTAGGFDVFTSQVTTQTIVTISVSGGGVTRSAQLTVLPDSTTSTASVSAISVNPATVTGGSSSQGTVTLSGAAPAGGTSVSLSSSGAAAGVPASVAVAQGATSATFAISTSSVTASTPVTITASAGGVSRSATLTVAPSAQQTQTATLTLTASGRSGTRVTSSPAGLSVAVGSTGSASFSTGASITLSASNGRDAIWSGACSSGGAKRKSCTFTLTANASVTANVQ